jgi:cytochrome c oxidase subunit 3
MFNLSKMSQRHGFHLVDPSPWPLVCSGSVLSTAVGAVMYFHSYSGGGLILTIGLVMTTFGMSIWWRDIVRESTYEGHHTNVVQLG